MDHLALVLQALGVLWSVVVLIAAAVVVGSRKGARETSARVSTEQAALITVLEKRVDALTEENKRQAATLAELQLELARVRAELEVEKRITARIEQGSVMLVEKKEPTP